MRYGVIALSLVGVIMSLMAETIGEVANKLAPVAKEHEGETLRGCILWSDTVGKCTDRFEPRQSDGGTKTFEDHSA